MNTDLRDQLSSCHQRIKELTIFEENLRDQVIVNQLLCIDHEQAIAEREKAISDLKSERNTIKGWCDAFRESDPLHLLPPLLPKPRDQKPSERVVVPGMSKTSLCLYSSLFEKLSNFHFRLLFHCSKRDPRIPLSGTQKNRWMIILTSP